MRLPTFTERIVFRITCMGLCEGKEEDREMCARECGKHLPNLALRSTPILPLLSEKK